MIDCILCHSQCNLCDHLRIVTMEILLDSFVLSPKKFPNHQIAICSPLCASTYGPRDLSGPHVLVLRSVFVWIFCLLCPCSSLWHPLKRDTSSVGPQLLGARRETLDAFTLHWAGFMGVSWIGDTSLAVHSVLPPSPVLCCTQGLSQEAFESHLARNLFWQFVNLVGLQSIFFISRTCPHC